MKRPLPIPPQAPCRRLLLVGWACVLSLVSALVASADTSGVPPSIQAELVGRLCGYDRGFEARAGDVARVLILTKPKSVRSEVAAEDMRAALSRVAKLGGLPHTEAIERYEGAETAATRVKNEHIAVVYLAPSLEDDMGAIRKAFDGVDVMTIAAVPAYVPEGAVLGFELESGKPKIVINLEQARRQKVDFPSDVLRLMKVYR